MPIMDGFTATKTIRSRNAADKVVIIACTALEEGRYKRKCLAAGMSDFLAKPIHLEKLKKVLTKYGYL